MKNDATCIKMRMQTVRKTIEMDIELSDEIEKMAKEKLWSFSKMCYILLQSAVKERNRKRDGKKVHISDHATDTR